MAVSTKAGGRWSANLSVWWGICYLEVRQSKLFACFCCFKCRIIHHFFQLPDKEKKVSSIKLIKLNNVDKKNQLDVTFVFFISLLIVAQHVSGNHLPIIRSWRLRDVIALCWYVPWLQEGFLYFSSNSCSTCFRQPCAHHQELATA